MALLSVRDLVVRFTTEEATVYAVNGVGFDVEQGETVGLVGESGCGKSVTSLALTRLLPQPAGRIEGGTVEFAGRSLLDLPEDELRHVRGRQIAMVFQDPLTSLNPVLTIERQLTEGILAHEELPPGEAHARAVELLKMVGISDAERRLKSYPHQLSGGMRQRAMIAMALALRPKLLIADEPTTALDVTIQAQVIDLIRDLTSRTGTAVLLITHDLGVVADMTKRTYVMYAGYIVETATTAELFARPRHPYTVGLLNSISRIDSDDAGPVRAVEGQPPEQTRPPTGCPFAPRCAWRLPICWHENPPLRAEKDGPIMTTGPGASHLFACHHPATDAELRAGRPLEAGFRAAPRPTPATPDELAAPVPT
ncbi:MAG TPA: ABC transporter ATP-binding protein [Candidatus Limnocylindrales bacterium]|jgi:oligopeptide/dipeptide ABC transporter ATP-binding protein|nr:ABC transporter ATP-binding protein [Candidatus Limnocylindrales bacterium]